MLNPEFDPGYIYPEYDWTPNTEFTVLPDPSLTGTWQETGAIPPVVAPAPTGTEAAQTFTDQTGIAVPQVVAPTDTTVTTDLTSPPPTEQPPSEPLPPPPPPPPLPPITPPPPPPPPLPPDLTSESPVAPQMFAGRGARPAQSGGLSFAGPRAPSPINFRPFIPTWARGLQRSPYAAFASQAGGVSPFAQMRFTEVSPMDDEEMRRQQELASALPAWASA